MIEPRYTVQELVALIREPRQAIYAALQRGQFPGAYKRGSAGRTNSWLVPESAVQAYLTSK